METCNMENTMLFGDVTMLGGDNFFFSDLDAFLMSPSSSSSSNYDSQLQGALMHIDAMDTNDVLTWSSEDCYRWAQRVCQEQCLDPHTLNLEFFYSVTGSTLAQYSRYDFCAHFNSVWGGVFYDQFHQLLAHAGVAVSFPTSDYESASSISSSYSDCSSSDSSSFTSSSASPYYENDDNAADLWDMPPLHVSEDITDLDSFLHQQVPQQQELLEQENLLLKDIGDAALVKKEHQMKLFPPEMPVVKDEVEQLSFYENTRDTSSTPEPVVPSCESLTSCGSLNSCKALEKIRTKSRKRERGPKNWEFVIRLLADKQYNPEVVRWEDKTCGTFRFVRPNVIAKLWGQRSNKPNLSYDNFARGLRYHYTTGALRPVSERQLVYQCGPKALSFLTELLQ